MKMSLLERCKQISALVTNKPKGGLVVANDPNHQALENLKRGANVERMADAITDASLLFAELMSGVASRETPKRIMRWLEIYGKKP